MNDQHENMSDLDIKLKRLEIEYEEHWGDLIDQIPTINFPSNWRVKVIPPVGGALVRFLIECRNDTVSVYLDAFDRLGYMGKPYWEVFPHADNVYRCEMQDTDKLMNALKESVAQCGGARQGAGRPARQTPRKALTIRVEPEVAEMFTQLCKASNRSQSEQLAFMVGCRASMHDH